MFRRKQRKTQSEPKIPESPLEYPSGLAVKTEAGTYLIKGKTKFKVFSPRVEQSWSLPTVQGSVAAVKNYPLAGTLGFRDGTLINNIFDGKIYLISDGVRRHITNPDVFDRYLLDKSKMITVSDQETKLHKEGEQLS